MTNQTLTSLLRQYSPNQEIVFGEIYNMDRQYEFYRKDEIWYNDNDDKLEKCIFIHPEKNIDTEYMFNASSCNDRVMDTCISVAILKRNDGKLLILS
jgi:hypothetical protein